MRFTLVALVFLYTLFTFTFSQADAQVNFSPAWGKRSADLMAGDAQDPSDYRRVISAEGCQTPLECLLRMQRLLKNRKNLPSIECENLINLCSG